MGKPQWTKHEVTEENTPAGGGLFNF